MGTSGAVVPSPFLPFGCLPSAVASGQVADYSVLRCSLPAVCGALFAVGDALLVFGGALLVSISVPAEAASVLFLHDPQKLSNF